MAGGRLKKNGEQMYVISPTVNEETRNKVKRVALRSEEHTSELQSH